MDKKNLFILLLLGITGFCSITVYAQDTDPDREVNIWAQQPVVVDGNSAEWHEPLNNYNTGTKLAFAFANDRDNLYLIIESLDEITTGKVLNGGLTLTINTAGKKKDGFKISFLGMNRPPQPVDSLAHAGERMHETGLEKTHDTSMPEPGSHETAVRVVQLAGFKRIPDGTLAIPNQQGIQVAAAFNGHRDYICELAIPLADLDLKGNELKAIAYNIKINKNDKSSEHKGGKVGSGKDTAAGGMKGGGMGGGMRGGHGGGMGGMSGGGGGGRGGRHSAGMGEGTSMGQDDMAGRASDFWVKYELAKPGDTYRAN